MEQKNNIASFEQFVVREFSRSMKSLRYIDPGMENIPPIRIPEKNVIIYRLALYSRSSLGVKFWQDTQKYTNPQTGFKF